MLIRHCNHAFLAVIIPLQDKDTSACSDAKYTYPLKTHTEDWSTISSCVGLEDCARGIEALDYPSELHELINSFAEHSVKIFHRVFVVILALQLLSWTEEI